MEPLARDNVFLRAFRVIGSRKMDPSRPEPQEQGAAETPSPTSDIDFRLEQLHNRRLFLKRMQNFKSRSQTSRGDAAEETSSEDIDEQDELEVIQKELQELEVKKEQMEKEGEHGQWDVRPASPKLETPHGGIYLLPTLTLKDVPLGSEVKTTPPEAEAPLGPIVPVGSLCRTPARTRCPLCQEVVVSEAVNRVGETAGLLCCMCAMIGCVMGCCLIPLFKEHLREFDHYCPKCGSLMHTYHPLGSRSDTDVSM